MPPNDCASGASACHIIKQLGNDVRSMIASSNLGVAATMFDPPNVVNLFKSILALVDTETSLYYESITRLACCYQRQSAAVKVRSRKHSHFLSRNLPGSDAPTPHQNSQCGGQQIDGQVDAALHECGFKLELLQRNRALSCHFRFHVSRRRVKLCMRLQKVVVERRLGQRSSQQVSVATARASVLLLTPSDSIPITRSR